MCDIGNIYAIMEGMKISEFTDKQLIAAYQKTGNVHKAGELIGVRGGSLHRRLQKCGYIMDGSGKRFTDEDRDRLINNYDDYVTSHRLQDLADEMGRTKPFICRMAKKHGLTQTHRKNKISQDGKKRISKAVKKHQDEHGHPKGAKGLVFSDDAKKKMSKSSKANWKKMTEDDKAKRTFKILKTRAKNGTLVPSRHKVSWKQGWREIGGYRKYYRSRWEANYARYLEWLKGIGEIKAWEHEPDVFWFEKIKRGCVSYLPDFKVTENDGSIAYHEVKGWMDARSKTKIRRMAKYYPEVKLIVIDAKPYKIIERKIGCGLDGWE